MKNQGTTHNAEDEADDGIAVEQFRSTEDEEEETENLHANSVPDSGESEDEFVLPRTSSSEKFFVKLKRRLSSIGVRYEKLTKLTADGDSPPCFKIAGADYDEWLAAASLTSDVPYRYDMPAEPNYCRDCTVGFRGRAIRAGACRFSNLRFEIASSNGEKEVVGVSRSPTVIPTGYRVYREMVIDEIAIEDASLEMRRGRAPGFPPPPPPHIRYQDKDYMKRRRHHGKLARDADLLLVGPQAEPKS